MHTYLMGCDTFMRCEIIKPLGTYCHSQHLDGSPCTPGTGYENVIV